MLKQRTLLGYIGLTIITLGIYPFYYWCVMTDSINKICAGDGRDTNSGLVLVLCLFTFGIYPMIWLYIQGDRMKSQGDVMGVPIADTGLTYLLWHLLGAFLCGIGPFVAIHKFLKNYNSLVVIYNNKLINNAH